MTPGLSSAGAGAAAARARASANRRLPHQPPHQPPSAIATPSVRRPRAPLGPRRPRPRADPLSLLGVLDREARLEERHHGRDEHERAHEMEPEQEDEEQRHLRLELHGEEHPEDDAAVSETPVNSTVLPVVSNMRRMATSKPSPATSSSTMRDST